MTCLEGFRVDVNVVGTWYIFFWFLLYQFYLSTNFKMFSDYKLTI